MEEDTKLVSVYRPENEAEYLIIASLLEEHEIPSYAKNRYLQSLFGIGGFGTGFSMVTGPVNIKVPESFAAEARELIRLFKEKKYKCRNAGEVGR